MYVIFLSTISMYTCQRYNYVHVDTDTLPEHSLQLALTVTPRSAPVGSGAGQRKAQPCQLEVQPQ